MKLAQDRHHHIRNVTSKFQRPIRFPSIYFSRFSENSKSYKNALMLENQNFLKKCYLPKVL